MHDLWIGIGMLLTVVVAVAGASGAFEPSQATLKAEPPLWAPPLEPEPELNLDEQIPMWEDMPPGTREIESMLLEYGVKFSDATPVILVGFLPNEHQQCACMIAMYVPPAVRCVCDGADVTLCEAF